jgi:hypothetical protein
MQDVMQGRVPHQTPISEFSETLRKFGELERVHHAILRVSFYIPLIYRGFFSARDEPRGGPLLAMRCERPAVVEGD